MFGNLYRAVGVCLYNSECMYNVVVWVCISMLFVYAYMFTSMPVIVCVCVCIEGYVCVYVYKAVLS